jgi:hypothetical protein
MNTRSWDVDNAVESAVSVVLAELRSMGCELTPNAVKRLRQVIADSPERRERARQAMAAGGRKSREARLSKQNDLVMEGEDGGDFPATPAA